MCCRSLLLVVPSPQIPIDAIGNGATITTRGKRAKDPTFDSSIRSDQIQLSLTLHVVRVPDSVCVSVCVNLTGSRVYCTLEIEFLEHGPFKNCSLKFITSRLWLPLLFFLLLPFSRRMRSDSPTKASPELAPFRDPINQISERAFFALLLLLPFLGPTVWHRVHISMRAGRAELAASGLFALL